MCTSSQVFGAAVVHGEADVPDHHDQQVQEETGGATGLPEDVSGEIRPLSLEFTFTSSCQRLRLTHNVTLCDFLQNGSAQGLFWPDGLLE